MGNIHATPLRYQHQFPPHLAATGDGSASREEPEKKECSAASASTRHHKTRRSQEDASRRRQRRRSTTSSSSSSCSSSSSSTSPPRNDFAHSRRLSQHELPQLRDDDLSGGKKTKDYSLSQDTVSSHASSDMYRDDEDDSTPNAMHHDVRCTNEDIDGCAGCFGGSMRALNVTDSAPRLLPNEPPQQHRNTSVMGSLYNQLVCMQWRNMIPCNYPNNADDSSSLSPQGRQPRPPSPSTPFFASYDTKHIMEQKHRKFWELVQKLLVLNDVVAMIRLLLDYIVKNMDVATCAIFLIDQNTQVMSRFSPGQMSVSGIDPAKGVLGKTLASGQPICRTNFKNDSMYDSEIDLAQDLPSQKLLSVPLIENEVVYAVIQATTRKSTRKEMDDLHIKLLSWLGPILSSCMRKCIEYHDVLLSDRTQKALLHIISSSDTEDTVLNLVEGVIQGACHITNAERLSLFMVDWETEELWSLSSSYHEETLRLPLHASILGMAARTRTILNVCNPPTDPRFNRIVDHRRGVVTRCALYVPVGVQNTTNAGSSRPIAVLEILNKVEGGEFTFDDECAFEAFASQVAVILRRRSNEIEYIKLLADTRAEKVLAQRAKSQVNILEAYTSISSTMRRPSDALRNSFLKSHSRVCPVCAGEHSEDKQIQGQSLYHGCSWHRNLDRPFAKSGSNPSIPSWDFNVFQADMDSLPQMIEDMFMQFSLPKVLGITKQTMQNFIMVIKDNYHPNPFHNFLHAFSVVHTAYLLLSTTEASRMLRPLDIAGCLIAALCHDVDHPGHTNGYEIASGSQLAMLYSDESVLERHHAYTTFKLISKEKNANILEKLSAADYRHIRKVIITAILGTDMANHFKFCETLEKTLNPATRHLSANTMPSMKKDSKPSDVVPAGGEKASSCTEIRNVLREAVFQSDGSAASTPRGSNSNSSSASGFYFPKSLSGSSQSSCTRELGNGWTFNGTVDERLFIVKTIVHASDLSGQVFSKPVALKWSNMISKEFAYQALLEQAENHPISYHHLDDPLQMVEGQLFFAQKIVSPLWDLVYVMFPEVKVCVENLAENVAHYEQELQRLKLCKLEEERKVSEASQDDDSFRRDEGLAVPGLAKCTPAKFNSFCAIPEDSESVDESDDGECIDRSVREFAASAIHAIELSRQSPFSRSGTESNDSSSESEDEIEADVVQIDDCESDVLLERC
uniref:Phosphodiesterase n=1 Tax=Globisporangium ultimum (strain ATCC 200006 / CBS 805.95 / DAOM BR144) TaxID=431595 RepID=K3WQH5_GLOUD